MERRTQCKWGETEKNQMKYPVFQVIPQKLNTMCHPWGKVSRHHTWCPLTPAPGCMVHCPLPPCHLYTRLCRGIQTGDTSGRVTGWLLTYFPRGLNRARVQPGRLAHIRVMGNILRDAVTSWLTTREEKILSFSDVHKKCLLFQDEVFVLKWIFISCGKWLKVASETLLGSVSHVMRLSILSVQASVDKL